jgi:hypothetical protein
MGKNAQLQDPSSCRDEIFPTEVKRGFRPYRKELISVVFFTHISSPKGMKTWLISKKHSPCLPRHPWQKIIRELRVIRGKKKHHFTSILFPKVNVAKSNFM